MNRPERTTAEFLARLTEDRRNSLTFLRLLFAVMVIYSHAYVLGGFGKEPLMIFSLGQSSFGFMAVAGFFIISGFLITRSYQRSSTLRLFMMKRVMRIFPAFWFCLLVSVLVVGPFLYQRDTGRPGYFLVYPNNPLGYLASNLFLKVRQHGIADLFANNPYPREVNGSLWTLFYEFSCYLSIPVLGLLGAFQTRRKWFLAAFLVLVGLNGLEGLVGHPPEMSLLADLNSFGRRIPDLFLYFMAGSVYYNFRERIRLRGGMWFAGVLLLLLVMPFGGFKMLSPLVLPYLVFWLACKLPFAFVESAGDYSYGTYLFAFPMQQALVAWKMNSRGFGIYFLFSILLTLPWAVISWHLVEKQTLGLKTRLTKRLP